MKKIIYSVIVISCMMLSCGSSAALDIPKEAIIKNDVVTVRKAIENGADVNGKNNYGRTALDYAEHEGHNKMIALLKKHGAK